MERPSRQLNAFPCRACGGTLLVHDEGQRELVCPLCETTMKVPRRLREDFDMGKKLPFDADGELQRAIDEAVERRYAAPELPRWVFLALALLGAGLGATAWVLSEPAPETLDYVWGALAGLALGVLPIGWTASWMATMRLGRAAARATRRVRGRDLRCPRCETPIMPPVAPGACSCPSCKLSLVVAEGGAGPADERKRAIAEDVDADLAKAPWLEGDRLSAGDVLLVLGVYVAVFVSAFLFALY